jgi:stress-induced morphogen
LNQAKQVFNELVDELTNHGIQTAQTAAQMVAQAINKVNGILTGKSTRAVQQRDFQDFIINQLGLGAVWDQIQALGGQPVSQIIQEGLQLVLAGKDVLAQAQVVFNQLVQDLINHTAQASVLVGAAIQQVADLLNKQPKSAQRGIQDFIINELGLGAVWSIIQNLGSGFVSQIMSEGLQLLVSGKDKLKQAQAVFAELVDELTNHGIQTAQAAAQMVAQAINKVNGILSGKTTRAVQQRDLQSFVINELGLGLVWDEIQSLGANVVAQILNEGMQLVFAGQDVYNQAIAIFKQLVSDLTNHTANASTLVTAAIQTVAALLNKNPSRMARIDIVDFLLNTLGLQSVWTEIQDLGNNFVAQIISEGFQLIFAGQEKLQAAQAIFNQLVSDLTNHTAGASGLVAQAIAQVAALLNKSQ